MIWIQPTTGYRLARKVSATGEEPTGMTVLIFTKILFSGKHGMSVIRRMENGCNTRLMFWKKVIIILKSQFPQTMVEALYLSALVPVRNNHRSVFLRQAEMKTGSL